MMSVWRSVMPVAVSFYRPTRSAPKLSLPRSPGVVQTITAPHLRERTRFSRRASQIVTARSAPSNMPGRGEAGAPTWQTFNSQNQHPTRSRLPSMPLRTSAGAAYPPYASPQRRDSPLTPAYNVAASPVRSSFMPVSVPTSYRADENSTFRTELVRPRRSGISTPSGSDTASGHPAAINVIHYPPVSPALSGSDQPGGPRSFAPSKIWAPDSTDVPKIGLSETAVAGAHEAPNPGWADGSDDTLPGQQTMPTGLPRPEPGNDQSPDHSGATELYLDGHVLGQWVLDHLERTLSRPPTTANFVTGHGRPIWPGQSLFT